MNKPKPKKPVAVELSLQSLLWNQIALCNLPILILVIVASLDNADKQLLASSFPVLERTLHLSVETLGYFSMFTNLSYALSLPMWGWLVHTYGMAQIHALLSAACFSWGFSTVGIALAGSSVFGQAIFRALNGVALGSILPLSQTMLVGMVDVSMRGRAFGWMGLCEKLAGTAASASVFYFAQWETSYYILGGISIAMASISWLELTPRKRMIARRKSRTKAYGVIKENDSDDEHEDETDIEEGEEEEDDDDDTNNKSNAPKLTVRQIMSRIARVPAFMCLVAQGVFGGTPWDMMSFMIMLLDWRQFTVDQIVTIQFTTGLSATVGGWFGGLLGDYASSRYQTKGRILVALISVVGGVPLYGIFLFAKNFSRALLFTNLFHFVATWPTAGALRPICADLARNPSERAQIVSLWIVLEKTSGAIFGAPLVGYLTGHMIKLKEGVGDQQQRLQEKEMEEKAFTLAWNLFGLSTFFWGVCACFWIAMAFTIDKMPLTMAAPSQHSGRSDMAKKIELALQHKDSNALNTPSQVGEDIKPLVSQNQSLQHCADT